MTPADIQRIRAPGRDKCPPDLAAERDALRAELERLREAITPAARAALADRIEKERPE